MITPSATPLYKRHRFPAEIISHGVWLYFRFSLSYHDVQEMMGVRLILTNLERRCMPHNTLIMHGLNKEDPALPNSG